MGLAPQGELGVHIVWCSQRAIYAVSQSQRGLSRIAAGCFDQTRRCGPRVRPTRRSADIREGLCRRAHGLKNVVSF